MDYGGTNLVLDEAATVKRGVKILKQAAILRQILRIVNSKANRLRRNLKTGKSTTPETPLVSVIIPIYDRTAILAEAIDSVLKQSYQNFELLLVLDGSPEATELVAMSFAKDPRVRIHKFDESSGTAVRQRNLAIALAEGHYVSFLDSDDVMHHDRLKKSVEELNAGADVVYGAWRAKLDGTREIDQLKDGQLVYSTTCDYASLLKACIPCQSTVTLRAELFDSIGLIKSNLRYREDHELWMRAAYSGAKFQVIPDELCTLRLHSGNNELNFLDQDQHWEAMALADHKSNGPTKAEFLKSLDGTRFQLNLERSRNDD